METEQGIRKTPTIKIDREKIKYNFTDNAECPSKDCLECKNLENCEDEIINRWAKIPDHVFYKLLRLHTSAIKTFLFLSRRANFVVDNKEYGTCKFTYKPIVKATGLSKDTICKGLKELFAAKLINYEVARHPNNPKWKTGHIFYILWMFLDKEIKEKLVELTSIKTF
ncbi:MAG: hypothetical protein ABSF20_01310 [Smithella sp.]|jgi:hypothetical protein